MIRMTCTLTKQGQFCLFLPSLVVKSDTIKRGTRLCLAGTRSELVIDWYCRQRMERTLLVLLLVTIAFAIFAEGKYRCLFCFVCFFCLIEIQKNLVSYFRTLVIDAVVVLYLWRGLFVSQLDLNPWRKDHFLACPPSAAQQVRRRLSCVSMLLGAQQTDGHWLNLKILHGHHDFFSVISIKFFFLFLHKVPNEFKSKSGLHNRCFKTVDVFCIVRYQNPYSSKV